MVNALASKGGMQSSAYEIDVDLETTPTANNKILTNDIEITTDLLRGDSGQLRLWWSFTTASEPYEVTVTKLGGADLSGSPLKVNADNSFDNLSDGYYRFDVGVAPGDLINLSCNVDISAINDFQVQRVPIAT